MYYDMHAKFKHFPAKLVKKCFPCCIAVCISVCLLLFLGFTARPAEGEQAAVS